MITDRCIIALYNDEEIWYVPVSAIEEVLVVSRRVHLCTEMKAFPNIHKHSFNENLIFYCKDTDTANTVAAVVNAVVRGLSDFSHSMRLSWDKQQEINEAKIALIDASGSHAAARKALLQRYEREEVFRVSSFRVVDQIDLLGTRIGSIKIGEYNQIPDEKGRYCVYYKVEIRSKEYACDWELWRRYSEFRELRNAVTKELGESRASLPIPSRLPWSLSENELQKRIIGLNNLVTLMMASEAISELYCLRFFFTNRIENLKWFTSEED
mmetsp:Transcript_13540/g.16808  ORF Transcript_13540/g.16808 Transcript_13540/m.16808 type:complete len:268 (+) Transcript_13540:3-806(+)